MAVFKRTYRGYSGAITPAWSRFLVMFRYSRRNLFRSKLLTAFFVLSLFVPLGYLLAIYANDHISALTVLGPQRGPLFKPDGPFFLHFLFIQSILAFLLTAFIGPGLVSPDLANGALTLYLCRPFSPLEYILGKLSVLAILLSWLTWIPCLVVFFAQASLSGWDWMISNLWIASAIFLGAWLWILSSSLLSLALSAWIKWRLAAGASLLAVLFMGLVSGKYIENVLHTQQGQLFNILGLTNIIWQDLFHDSAERDLSAGEAWFGILAFAAICFWILVKKIKANEVVR